MNFLFEGLSEEKINLYRTKSNMVTVNYQRGNIIVCEGDECNHLYIINSGTVIAKNLYSDGHESVIKVLSKNDSFGEALLFSNEPKYKANFICQTNASISIISYEELLSLIKFDSKVNINLLKRISNNLIGINNHLKILSKKSVRGKFLTFLYITYCEKKQLTFCIPYNKTDLALFLNVERPTLSKEISALVKERVISNISSTYTIIDLFKLEKYL